MAIGKIVTEYHLTPGGWVQGTTRSPGQNQEVAAERPADALETVVLEQVQQSPWSREEISWRYQWVSPQASGRELSDLYEKYGIHPAIDGLE